ncbi:hypothetical protein V6N11_053393 [Hibiscus sabdariffa]|uniref:Uncharacterized protein n=1 Tax=Hibiscus sabdariffa TaxID=183260 RepID=A0ABR2UDP8_9ROSI
MLSGLCFEELMAMDTVALLVQKLGVTCLDNVHTYAYYGVPLANDRNGQAMDLMVNPLVPRNLVIRQHCELEGRSCYYLGFCCISVVCTALNV